MPGIFGFIESHQGALLKQVEKEAKKKLIHLSDYVFKSLLHANYLAGFTAPYQTNQGPYFDKINGLVVNFDGRLDFYWDENGRKVVANKGSENGIIIDLYLKYNNQITDYLSGVYNVSIFDVETQKILLFNDILGNRILYYFDDGNIFIYGTELKVFLAYPAFNTQINQHAMADLCNFYRIWGDKSLLDGVKTLPAGSLLERDNAGVSVKNYFVQKQTNEYGDRNNDEVIEEGWELFNQSIDRSILGKSTVSVPISAGIDSRLILAVTQSRNVKINAFTFADSSRCIEYEISKIVTKALEISNHKFLLINPDDAGRDLLWVSWLNDGMELASASYHALLAKKISEHGDGLLNGIFGGHMSFSDGFYFPEYDHSKFSYNDRFRLFTDMVKARGRSVTQAPPQAGVFSEQYSSFLYDAAKETITKGLTECEKVSDNFAEQIIHYIRSILLRNMMNRKDINRYFQRDELICADPDLFRFYLKIPYSKKQDNSIYYAMIKKYLPSMVNLPTIHTGERQVRKRLNDTGLVDESKITRMMNKMLYYAGRLSGGRINYYDRFSYKHYNQWYRTSKILREQMEEILLDDRTLSRDHLNPDTVKLCIQKQRNGSEVYDRLLLLVQIELFYRYFIENDAQPQVPGPYT